MTTRIFSGTHMSLIKSPVRFRITVKTCIYFHSYVKDCSNNGRLCLFTRNNWFYMEVFELLLVISKSFEVL